MHIAFFNPQGNFDSKDSYWTEHPDFGGQLVYVKEVAMAMANQGHKVDIITRKIEDEKWPEFKGDLDSYKDVNGVRIIRVPCGPKEFLPKEQLWDYLEEWVENIIDIYTGEGNMPDFVTTHYGDGGLAGVMFKEKTGIPFSFTGHSLGAQKLDKLLASTDSKICMDKNLGAGNIVNNNDNLENDIFAINDDISTDNDFMGEDNIVRNDSLENDIFSIYDGTSTHIMEELENKYKFKNRIAAERSAMKNSSVIFVSTGQERDEQYKHPLYKGAGDVNNPEKFKVVPPGANTKVFSAVEENSEDEYIRTFIKAMFERDLDKNRRELPAIVAASRLDPKKNHIALVKAYAENKDLQEKANLVITLRGVDNAFVDYSRVKEEEKIILDKIMKVINDYNLKGKVSMFSINGQGQLAACYRELARRKSIFALTAVYEPFGLAPIEAMSCGLPAVVTKYGGPSEVLYEEGFKYGVLVDVFNIQDISNGILEALENYEFYKKMGMKRVESKYTWNSTARNYIQAIEEVVGGK